MNDQDLIQAADDAEQAFLGSLLLDRDAMAEAFGTVIPEAFGRESHRLIFQAMESLWRRREPCDQITAISEIRAMGVGDDQLPASYLTDLMAAVPTSVHVGYYGAQVMQFARRRAIAAAGARIVRAAYGDAERTDAGELIALLRTAVSPFESITDDTVRLEQFAMQSATETVEFWEGNRVDPVLPTGLKSVDRMLGGGLRPGQLILIGARPGMGKSALMLQLAIQHRTHIVSLEMSRAEIMNRIIAMTGDVPYRVAHDPVGDVTQRERWLDGADQAAKLPVSLSDKPGQTTMQIETEVQRRVIDDGTNLVIIDHLDWLGDKFRTDSPEVRTAELVHRCKAMARACGVPVVVLAQLNRNVEHRPGFFPYLSDFRNSGAIEQDADVALLLYRRRYYSERGMLDPDTDADYFIGSNLQKTDVIVAKNRNGAIGSISLGWLPEQMKFLERISA